MRIACLIATSLLAGCTTYGEIADRKPFRTEMVRAAPVPLRDCVLDGLRRGGAGWTYTSSALHGVEHIMAEINFGGGEGSGSYGWEASFIPAMNATLVEVRTRKTILGNPVYPDELWPTIMSCADS